MLKNAYLFAKIGAYTAEKEPLKVPPLAPSPLRNVRALLRGRDVRRVPGVLTLIFLKPTGTGIRIETIPT